MKTNSDWAPGPDLRILGAERQGAGWVVTAEAPGPGCCPGCDRPSRCRHGWRVRHLQDLPVQGAAVTLNLKVGRWRCRSPRCDRRTFTTRLPLIAEPFVRRTRRGQDPPYVPLGQFFQGTAYRSSVSDIPRGSFTLFWGVRKS